MMKLIARTTVVTAAVLIAGGAGVDGAAPVRSAAPIRKSVVRQVTIPAGTLLRLRVDRAFGSDISRLEDPVSATLARPIMVDGRTVLREGSLASGFVSQATRPGKVKGRGRVAVRFTRITPAGHETHYAMHTRPWVGIAPPPETLRLRH